MTNGWQTVMLGEILKRIKNEIQIEDESIYKQVTIRLWNKGVILRGRQQGSEIKTKRQFLVRTGQLILSRIDVRNGAIGLCPPELEGAIVSNDFWVYDFDETLIFPKFLALFVTTPGFLDDANRTSSGTTKRIRAEENAFLRIKIPLPPLNEQRLIVGRIEALARRVSEAQRLRREAVEEAHLFWQTIQRNVFVEGANWNTYALNKVAPINMGQSPSGNSYNFNREGVPLLNGPTEFGSTHPTPRQWTTNPTKFCKSGEILICVRGATTGKMNWADQEYCIGRGLAALTVDTSICLPEYVFYFVKTQTRVILDRTAGSTFPNLPGEKLKTLPIPVPPIDEQRRIAAYLDGLLAQVNMLGHLQAESQKEIDALLPSILDKAFKGE